MLFLDRSLIVLIRAYQLLLAPVLPMSCRYWPSCSYYAREAVARHGAVRGGWLALTRIARCNPWSRGGVDPVPEQLIPVAGLSCSVESTGGRLEHRPHDLA